VFLTGSFRLLEIKDFRNEVQLAYLLETVFSFLPMLFCQIFNNYETDPDNYAGIQSITISFKVITVVYLFFEIFFLVWECRAYRNK
jgi:hypothetical protein